MFICLIILNYAEFRAVWNVPVFPGLGWALFPKILGHPGPVPIPVFLYLEEQQNF